MFQQARTAYARALQRNPFHALAALGRARLCRDWGAFDPAVRLAATATGLDPFYREAYELTGFLFARDLPEAPNQATGRPVNVRDAARGAAAFDKALEVATGDAVPADAHFGRALAILAQVPADAVDDPRIAAAKQDLEQALTAVPKPGEFRSAEPRQIKAAIDYIRLYVSVHERVGDAAGAEAARQQLAAVREGAVQAAQAELKEGEDLRDALDYAAAIRHFDRAIELDPEFSKAYYERGTCYLKIGNFVPGILDFSRALELDPRIADQVYNKVYQISCVVDLNRVITELNKIVGEHPDVSYVVFLRGFFYVAKTEFKQVEREDLDAGIADFDRCLELNPTHVTAFLYRGFLWMKMADREAEQATRNAHYQTAMTNYARALELDPESGISHYLQALCWSVMSTEEDCDEEEALARRLKAIAELKLSFESDFKGHERIRNEKGFEPIRGMDEFKALMER